MAEVVAWTLGFHVDCLPEHIQVFECMEKGMSVPEFQESAENISVTSLADFVRAELAPRFEKAAIH